MKNNKSKKKFRLWRDLPIGSKLMVVMLFIIIMVFASNIIMYTMINSLIIRLDSVYSSNVNMTELRDSLSQVQSDLYRYLEVRDYDSLSSYFKSSEELRDMLEPLSNKATDNHVDVLEKNIKNMSTTFLEYADEAVTAKRGMNVSVYRSKYEKAMDLYSYINSDIATLNEQLFQNNAASYQSLQRALRYMELASFLLLMSLIVIGLLLMRSMTNNIVAPLVDLASAARFVGEGDFEQKLPPAEGDDEIGILTSTFNTMVDSLNAYVIKVKESAEVEKVMKEKELMMENHLKEAQLRFLQAQINPHFLFNSLNAGVQLAEMEDDEKTAIFLGKMADFFRYNVKKGTEDTTILEELNVVENYIYILNVRFAGDIIFDKEVDESVLHYRMPSMILQPLVENSVNHGIREMLGEGWIKLSISDGGDSVIIRVEDNGKGMSQEQIDSIMGKFETRHEDDTTGIGMDNVISRLALYFEQENVLQIESEGEGKGTTVTLTLPKIEV